MFALHAEVERATFICNFGLSNDVYTLANSVIFPIFGWYNSNDLQLPHIESIIKFEMKSSDLIEKIKMFSMIIEVK